MAFATNFRVFAPIMRSLVLKAPRAFSRPTAVTTTQFNSSLPSTYNLQAVQVRSVGSDANAFSQRSSRRGDDQPASLSTILEREIQEETAELNQRLSSDQFPGFSVETDDSDVKLTKQIGDTTVVVRFTVSSSLTEWAGVDLEGGEQERKEQDNSSTNYTLVSLPDFQVQICRDNRTLEVSCYFEEQDTEEASGETYETDPSFYVDELVIYEGEPRDNEFAVSADYFRDDLKDSLTDYLADHGIDDEFGKNLVAFATQYEKKQYIGLMKRLKDFVAK